MQRIFEDMEIEAIELDRQMPGVLVKARKPLDYHPAALDTIALYSVVTRRRVRELSALQVLSFKVRLPLHVQYRRRLSKGLRAKIKRLLPGAVRSRGGF